MKEYQLSLKKGEAFNTIKAHSLKEAISYFSKVKMLTPESLLDIYNVASKDTLDNLFCESYNHNKASHTQNTI